MDFLLKLILANAIIVASVLAGRKAPTLAGLLATMPLTTLVVLIWLHSETPSDYERMVRFTRGVLWGILPSMAFFLTARVCFEKQLPFAAALGVSFCVWAAGAMMHRWLLG